jgi:YegS/Rv2252/BmrU family lipid kinase
VNETQRSSTAQTLLARGAALLARISAPGSRTRVIANTMRWSAAAAAMRRSLREARTELRALGVRIQTPIRLVYYVLPTTLTGRRDGAIVTRPAAVAARARIIANPTSGSVHGAFGLHELQETAAWLSEHGLPTELALTERPGHAAELAREAANAGMDVVIAAGGDGTVNSVVQGLAGTRTALAVLPMGTINVWARETLIPLNTILAREVLISGVRRRVDLGRAGGRYFLLMAGIGLDAEVARRVEHSRLKRVGLKVVDYLATASRVGITHPSAKVWMRIDGKRQSVSALMVLVGNTRLYGGALTFAKQAVADDGWLDVVIVRSGGIPYRASVLIRALFRRASLGPRVRYERCHTVRFESHLRLPVQVDGEVIGTLPMTFTIARQALTVIVPRSAPAELFSRPPLPAPADETAE